MIDYATAFRESLARLDQGEELSDEFVDRFYDRFIASNATIAAVFAKADPTQPKKMLRESFRELLEFFVTHKTNPYLLTLSRIHGVRGYDIDIGLFDYWLDALVETVREFDPEANDTVELAWRVVMAPGLAFMKFYRDK